MIKKLLSSTLLITWLLLGSFSYWVDSYTCSYQWIINGVSNKYWVPNTNYIYNCNDLWGIYDCNVYTNVSVSNWTCYQFSWFDLNSYTDVNLTFDFGSTYITFSYNNNNLNMLNGYMVCNPSRISINWRITTYNPSPSFIITEIQESSLLNYSETYTCPTCNTSSLENQLSSCQTTLSGCMSDLYNTENDLSDALDELASCQNSSQCDYSWYILESEITSWYCEVQFWLISPSDCPNSSWSGDIMWSSFWVNNFQVMWGRNIYLYIPDWLNWDYTYVDENLQIEVENEWDSEYIEWVIDNQTTLPNKTDLNNIITGVLPLFIPGLVIILFLYFIFRFIKKIF